MVDAGLRIEILPRKSQILGNGSDDGSGCAERLVAARGPDDRLCTAGCELGRAQVVRVEVGECARARRQGGNGLGTEVDIIYRPSATSVGFFQKVPALAELVESRRRRGSRFPEPLAEGVVGVFS